MQARVASVNEFHHASPLNKPVLHFAYHPVACETRAGNMHNCRVGQVCDMQTTLDPRLVHGFQKVCEIAVIHSSSRPSHLELSIRV